MAKNTLNIIQNSDEINSKKKGKENVTTIWDRIKKHPIICLVIIATIIIILVSVLDYYNKKKNATEDPNDPKNGPAAASAFINSVYIDDKGILRTEKSVRELWTELKQKGNALTKYLNSPEELAKLLSASMATDYPDTRGYLNKNESPDNPIDWSKYDIGLDSTEVQGIVKFKRALASNKTITMTYLPQKEFQKKISKYNESGSSTDRNEALKYFTIERTYDNSNIDGVVDVGSRPYNNDVFNVQNIVDVVNATGYLGLGKEYIAIQSACYDGKYYICALNRQDGRGGYSGGRIIWINASTKKVENTLDIGLEGGHMEGLTYDSDRKMLLLCPGGKNHLIQINNDTKKRMPDYAKVPEHFGHLAYSVTTKELIGLDNGRKTLTFMKYDSSNNEYVKQRKVNLDYTNFVNVQGISSDGQVVFFSDSKEGSDAKIYAFDFQGTKVEEHAIGTGYTRNSKEVENCFTDKDGTLIVAFPHMIAKVKEYKANPVDWENSIAASSTTGNNSQVEEILKYACSWVGKIGYKLGAGGHLTNGGKSDCSHFVHRVFGHFGLMEDTSEYFDKYGHSLYWGRGGDAGGVPGTVIIKEKNIARASPGDVIWEHYGSGSKNHVSIYLGNGKRVECTAHDDKGVTISKAPRTHFDAIVHFTSLPTDPNAYFDPETGILHSSSGSSTSTSTLSSSTISTTTNHSTSTANSSTSTSTSTGSLNTADILKYACSWEGKVKYVIGKHDPLKVGARESCSGFVFRVYEHFGLMKEHKSAKQWSTRTVPKVIEVSSNLSQASPGDIIWRKGSSDCHVSIYLGKGKRIHSTPGKNGVNIAKVSQSAVHKIFHFSDLPPNPGGYFDPKTGILYNGNGSKNSASTVSSTSDQTTKSNSSSSSSGISKLGKVDTDILFGNFSDETRKIIEEHRFDFNKNTYKQFIENYPGGYDGYVQSLGGVFKKYGGKNNNVKVTDAGTLQEVAEYTWGLFAIWGFDYWNKDDYHSWGKANSKVAASAYYPSHKLEDHHTGWGNIDKICSNPKNAMRTNCNCGSSSFLIKCGLTNDSGFTTHDLRGKKIDKVQDLLIGDVVNFYGSDGKWHHVAVVGEIDPELGPILYDTGSRFIRTGNFKYALTGKSYKDYDHWVGRRHFNIDQSTSGTISTDNENNSSNPTSFKVKVATWQERKENVVSTDSSENKSEKNFSMTEVTIPYQSIVAQYRMPFNYLWAMLIYSNDSNYTFDLADLVRNSQIEITIHDNYNKTTTKTTEEKRFNYYYEGQANAKFDYAYTLQVPAGQVAPPTTWQSHTLSDLFTATSDSHEDYKKTTTIINKTNTLDIALTLADTWCVKYEKKYKYNGSNSNSSTSSQKLNDEDGETEEYSTISNSSLISKILDKATRAANSWMNGQAMPGTIKQPSIIHNDNEKQTARYTITNQKVTTQEKTLSSSYTGEPEKFYTEEEPKFATVFNKHYNARSNILSAKAWLFEALESNADTVNMVDLTKYLMYRATGTNYGVTTFDFSVYNMQYVGSEYGGTEGYATLNMNSTRISREQFIEKTKSYSAALANGPATKTFRDNAGVIYDVCVKNNVNPVLCAAQGWAEQNWMAPGTSPYNYWGIAVYNGQNYGNSYPSMEAAVENYCKNINQRMKGENGALTWSKSNAKYNNKFTGSISTLYDVLSNWACADDYATNPANQAKHAANYVDKIITIAKTIYGEGALDTAFGGADFVKVAEKIWKIICNGNYRYGGSSIPCTGSTVDCSSFASWVIYEYGYTEFKGGQHCTKDFKNTNWNQKYGWTEINVAGGQNPYQQIQPGDLFVRDNGNNDGHITLVVRKENGKIYCYDCGNSGNWSNNKDAHAIDESYMLKDPRAGKIIRVTQKK